jgi:hypothetical protein
VTRDVYGFQLLATILERKGIPGISDFPPDTLLYALNSSIGLSRVRTYDLGPLEFGSIKRREICVEESLATAFFLLAPETCVPSELGWVTLAWKEAR